MGKYSTHHIIFSLQQRSKFVLCDFNVIQNVPYPIFICGRPHTINEQIKCGNMVVRYALKLWNKLHKQGTDLSLTNTTTESVSCESNYVYVKYQYYLLELFQPQMGQVT